MITLSKSYNSRHIRGFSAFEFVIVLIIVIVLITVLLPRFQKNIDEAHILSVQATGQALSSAVNLVHMHWIMMGQPQEVDRVIGFGRDDIATSATGWPSDAARGLESRHDADIHQDLPRCRRIWDGLLKGSAKAEVGERALSHWAAYEISAVANSTCRFTYTMGGYLGYIDYDLTSGEVRIHAEGTHEVSHEN